MTNVNVNYRMLLSSIVDGVDYDGDGMIIVDGSLIDAVTNGLSLSGMSQYPTSFDAGEAYYHVAMFFAGEIIPSHFCQLLWESNLLDNFDLNDLAKLCTDMREFADSMSFGSNRECIRDGIGAVRARIADNVKN